MPGFQVNGLGGIAGGTPGPQSTREYLYSYTWEVLEVVGNFDNLVVTSVKDITLPTFSVGVENYQGASLEYKFAKSVSYEDIKITFYDSQGLLPTFKEWRESVWTSGDGLKPADEYKKNSRINCFDSTWQLDQTYQLIGSWPSTIRYGDLTYTKSDVKIVEITITYDWAEES